MVLNSREKFIAFYSMFLTTHIGLGVNPAELDKDGMGHIFKKMKPRLLLKTLTLRCLR